MEEIRNDIENEESAEVTEEVSASEELRDPATTSPDVVEVEEDEKEASEVVTEPEVPRVKWSFASQVAADRKELRKNGRRGALIYSIIMTVMFVICFAALAILLITGFGTKAPSTGGSVGGSSNANLLTQLYSEVSPSVVTVSVSFNNGSGFGSGFIYSDEGYIITNYHVIEDAKKISVIMNDGSQHKATLVGGDEMSDVAVLKINASWLTPVKIGDSSALVIGEEVFAIGTPIEIECAGTLTHGIISGLNRKVSLYEDNGMLDKTMTLIQTNTILNPGNSGGPLLNMNGEVIGINTMKYVSSSDGSINFEGVGFSIPINSALVIVDEIIEKGSYSGSGDVADKGVQLGITCSTVYKDESVQIGDSVITPTHNGVIITDAPLSGYPADGKLKQYDIVISFDGAQIETIEDLRQELYSHKVGDTVALEVIRDNKTVKVEIKL